MDRELTKDELEAQIDEKTRDLAARVDTLKHEADVAAGRARERAETFREESGRTALVVGGGALAAGLVLKLLAGGSDDEAPRARRRVLTPAYLDRLALDVDRRLGSGDDLAAALDHALGRRAPLLLERPGGGGSVWRRLFGFGLLAAAGVGLNLACEAFYGRSLVDLVRARAESLTSGTDDVYPPVHGTAGAEMPDPRST